MKIKVSSKQQLKKDVSREKKYMIMAMYALSMIVFGFLVSSPVDILKGMVEIFKTPDMLITDYIGVGGMGAAFVNAGLLTLTFLAIIYKENLSFSGISFASLFLVAGFALFGKNILNVWSIVLGVFIYSKIQRDPFSKYVYISMFGTAMSPIVTEIFLSYESPLWIRLIVSMGTGVLIGVILPPLSTYLLRVHQGFNLYNIGFTAGIIGTVLVSVLRSYGLNLEKRMIWTTGNNSILGAYLVVMFISMIILGWYLNKKTFKGYKNLMKYAGRLVTDFTILEGYGVTLINMGINGLLSTLYIVAIKGDLNGPTIAGIFTIVGFGAFGKHPTNVIPIFMGVMIGAVTKVWGINEPAIQLAALFGTALSPIAGEFGWQYGVIAGFLHSSVVLNVGVLHGGLNLYNNGFSAGIVAAVMIPIIEAFRKDEI